MTTANSIPTVPSPIEARAKLSAEAFTAYVWQEPREDHPELTTRRELFRGQDDGSFKMDYTTYSVKHAAALALAIVAHLANSGLLDSDAESSPNTMKQLADISQHGKVIPW